MRVLVCGGRGYDRPNVVCRVLDQLHAERPFALVMHGACGLDADDPFDAMRMTGADAWADDWAGDLGVPVARYPAAWKKRGRSAGPHRNSVMLLQRPDLVVAFPGGAGTRDMVRRARVAGTRVVEVADDGTMREVR